MHAVSKENPLKFNLKYCEHAACNYGSFHVTNQQWPLPVIIERSSISGTIGLAWPLNSQLHPSTPDI